MADNRLNKTGLRYFLQKLAAYFAKKDDLDSLSEKVDDIISEGGEPNVIEVIKKNGTAVTPVNKEVDLTIPETSKTGTGENEKVTISEGQNSYDVPTTDAMEAYVEKHGGVIQKVKLVGTELQIDSSDKSVNIPAASASANGAMSSTDKSKLDAIEAEAQKNVQSDWSQSTSTADDFIKNKPTKLSDFTNDGDGTQGSTFPTTEEMEEAIKAQIGSVFDPKGSTLFENLPAPSASTLGDMYNVTNAFVTTDDFVEGAGVSVPAGTNVYIVNNGTSASPVYKYDLYSGFVDLSNYWNTTNLPAITTAEIDEVWNSVFNPSTP